MARKGNNLGKLKKEIIDALSDSYVEVAIVLGTLFLYILSTILLPSAQFDNLRLVLGFLVAFEFVFFLAVGMRQGIKKYGLKHEIVDTVYAFIIALAIWYAATLILHTSSPVSAVVSCSMLPNLERGDFVIVYNSDVKAYSIDMTKSEFEEFVDSPVVIRYKGAEYALGYSIYYYCMANSNDEACRVFSSHPELFKEVRGPLVFNYGSCEIDYVNGDRDSGPCVVSVSYKGKEYPVNLSNDILVYTPDKNDLFYKLTGGAGDIVHRAYFRINTPDGIYYLTKGDNNPVFDVQMYNIMTGSRNYPVRSENVKGRVLLRVPYLGYLKLFLFGFWNHDSQCNWVLKYPHVD